MTQRHTNEQKHPRGSQNPIEIEQQEPLPSKNHRTTRKNATRIQQTAENGLQNPEVFPAQSLRTRQHQRAIGRL